MTFRELFDRYRSGIATEEEQRLVEEELEKAALINEHLFGTWEEIPDPPAARELKTVKRSLRRRSLALVLTSVAVVLALLLSLPLAERLYFDPTATTTGDHFSDLNTALQCYYDLLAPEQDFVHIASYQDTGFASWSLELTFWDADSPTRHTYLTATVDKNEIYFPRNTLIYASAELFDFSPLEIPADDGNYDSPEQIEWALANARESDAVYAAVSFNADLDAAQLFDLMDRYGFIVSWAAVRVGPASDPLEPLIGMKLDSSRQDTGINALYPDLMGEVTAQNAQQHFRSMVEYCRDYSANTRDLGIIEDPGYYDTVLRQLEENGLRFYGAYINTSAQTFRDLAADGHITDFRLLEIREPGGQFYLSPSFGG